MVSTPPTIESGDRMTTLTFEDLTPGRVFELGTTVVDRDEMVAFARRFDPQPFHVDEDAAKASLFGGLAASGWFTAGLWMRLYVDEVLNNAASLGSPGGEEVAWPAPVFAGDELRASMEILDARVSRTRPGLGLVRLRAQMHRGDDVVFRSTFTGMFGTRDQP
jgi:acyl dehydratase